MLLSDLKRAVDSAIDSAIEYGDSPDNIRVSLQIDNMEGASIWADYDVELHYDNDVQASGCVLLAVIE